MKMLKVNAIPDSDLPIPRRLGKGIYHMTTDKKRYYVTSRFLDYQILQNEQVLKHANASIRKISDGDVSLLLRNHLQFGGQDSLIFDMQGINTFLYGRAKIFQDQSIRKIARALHYLEPGRRYLQMGAAGARANDHQPGGEVVEYSFIKGDGSGVSFSQSGYLPKGNEFSKKVPLCAADGQTLRDERTVYSHTMWLPLLQPGEPSNNMCLSITTDSGKVDLLDLINDVVNAVGIKAYGIQIVVWAKMDGDLPTITGRVLRHLPRTRIKTLDEARDIASEQVFPLYSGQIAVFFGTNYHRREKDWEAFRHGKRYEPNGHIHGYINADAQRDDQHNLFHLRNLLLTPDTSCQVIITPIRRIIRVEPVMKHSRHIISKTNGNVIDFIGHV